MKMRSLAMSVAVTLCVGLWNPSAPVALAGGCVVSGRAVRTSGEPISGVHVVIVRNGTLDGRQVFTRNDGFFEFILDPGRPIDYVFFSHSDHHPSCATLLSGTGQHRIEQVLIDRRERVSSITTALAVLQAYETLMILTRTDDGSIQEWLGRNWSEKQFYTKLEAFQVPPTKRADDQRMLNDKRQALLRSGTVPRMRKAFD